LPEADAAPVATPAKRPSWGLILGGAAVAVLLGLGITLLLDNRQQRQLPPDSVTVGPAPTVPVVEALDLGSPPPPPPPPPVDAAPRGVTPLAPHVPLPPLREATNPTELLPPTPTPSGTGSAEPHKPAGSPTGTEPAAKPAGSPSTTPGAGSQPSGGTSPRPTPPAVGPGESGTGGGTESETPPAEPKEKNSDEVMKDAQSAYVRGERGRAMELALQVAEAGGPDAERAWRFIGLAACSLRNVVMANKAYNQLSAQEHKQMVLEMCQRNGVTLRNGQLNGAPE
jgi:hypothetical protein